MSFIGVVVLNYNNYRDTIECVDSILNQTIKDFIILIIDNGSSNNSFEILLNKYRDPDKIIIVKNDINLGFAKGNNIGIKYLKTNFNCDYIFIANNDIILPQNLFFQILKVNPNNIGVISPSVFNPDLTLQKPSVETNNLTSYIFKTYISVIISMIYILMVKTGIIYYYKKVKTYKKEQNLFVHNKIESIKNYNYCIHGSAFFLTSNFFNHYIQLYPKTFLYWEELNLLWYLKKVQLKAIIIETDPVIHKGEVSTKGLFLSTGKKNQKLIHSIKSMINSTPLFFMNYKIIKRLYN